MTLRVVWLLLVCAAPAMGQQETIAPAPNEDPADVVARVRFERALRAELNGQNEDAAREAQAAIEANPRGRFAEPSRALIERVRAKGATGQAPPVRSTGVGPRVELVITATTSGLYLGSLLAAASGNDQKGAVALLMFGTGVGLVGSLAGSSGARVPQSMPQFLQNGVGYGTSATLLALAIGDAKGGRSIAGWTFAGAAAGGIAGLIASPYFTGGDSGAMTTGIIYGGVIPLLIEQTIGPHDNGKAPFWAALIGSTAGLFAGPILNARVHWSRGRWNLVSLGGGVGALMGGGVGVLTDGFKGEARAGLALLTIGTIAGLGLSAWLTSDFGADEPRLGAAGLLHLEGGKLSGGDALGSVTTVTLNGHTGPYLRAITGRF
jgi:hypothetical protein